MISFLGAAVAIFLVTGLVWRRYLQRISGGDVGYALSPGVAGVSLHHLMLALGALATVRQLYLAALSLPASPMGLPASLLFFVGLAVLCVRSAQRLPVRPARAAERG
jgi:hypothetical protein